MTLPLRVRLRLLWFDVQLTWYVAKSCVVLRCWPSTFRAEIARQTRLRILTGDWPTSPRPTEEPR